MGAVDVTFLRFWPRPVWKRHSLENRTPLCSLPRWSVAVQDGPVVVNIVVKSQKVNGLGLAYQRIG